MKKVEEMNLNECLEALRSKAFLYFDNVTVSAIADRISNLTRWIPVSERMPTEEDVTPLGGNMGIEFWSNKFGGMKYFCTIERFGIYFIQSNDITHWKRITSPEDKP
jgi:hypothetical protein